MNTEINWTAVEAVSTLLGSLIAALGIVFSAAAITRQLRLQQLAHALSHIGRLREQFISPTFNATRRSAALVLLADLKVPTDLRAFETDRYAPVGQVLDFLETVAYLWGQGVVPTDMLWNECYSWLVGYDGATTAYRADMRVRRADPTIWEYFDRAALAVEEYQVATLRKRFPDVDYTGPDDVRSFLEEEAALS